jgi:ABC-type cobalamin/Fe3+-siderophores transport system ATPase subunit
MGQTKSKTVVNDIAILRQLAETKGPIAVYACIDESLNRWEKEHAKFAITGRNATGKSTFINTIRNLKPEDDGFAMT